MDSWTFRLAAISAIWLLGCGDPGSERGAPLSTGTYGGGGSVSATGGNAGQAGASGGSAGTGISSGGAGGAGPESGTPELDGGNDARDSAGSAADADGSEQDAQRDDGRGEVDAAKGVLQIMPLGDSITNGSGGTNAGYRGFLFNLLKASARDVLFVGSSVQGSVSTTVNPLPSAQRHNEGHSSYSINEISNNLDGLDTTSFDRYGGASRDPNGGHWFDGITSGANARPPLYPDIILMMVGTNNASNPDRTAVRNQLHALITKITTQRPNAKLVVAQITPSDRPNNVSYNADVASEVTSFRAAGKNVSMVDMYTNFPADGIGGDGTHPNDKGYAVMAQRWFDGIVAIVP
jgi:hypothetical protein